MKLRTVRQLSLEGISNIFRNRLVSFVAFTTVLISLTIFGAFFSIIEVSKINIENLQDKIELIAFIENDTKEERMLTMKNEISKLPNVEKVTFVSQEDGLTKYKESFEEEGDSEMERIINEVTKNGENPIPASFEIKLIDTSKNEEIKSELEQYPEIYKVNDDDVITRFLSGLNETVKTASIVSTVVLGFASILLIVNTIKISVYTRRREIGIMKYIGGTNNFIRLPFLIEGGAIGAIGGTVSIIIVSTVYSIVCNNIMSNPIMDSLIYPSTWELLSKLIPMVLGIGITMGVVGSFISIRKYLEV